MKKILLTALTVMAAMTAGATKYVVYSGDALTDGEEQIPCNYYPWEGTYTSSDIDDTTSPDGRAHVFAVSNNGWFGGGWETTGEFDITRISATDASLVFSIKADAGSNFSTNVQFNNTTKQVSLQPEFTFDHDGEWHQIRLNLRETFGEVVKSFEQGDKLYAFALVGGAGAAGQNVYVTDIYFEEGDPIVAPEPETFEYGAVWYGTAEQDAVYNEKTYTAHVDYSVVANEDNTATVNATISGLEGVDGLVYEINFDGDYQDLNADGENFTATSNKTYELGDNIAGFFWIKYAMGGTVRIDFNCKFGAANEKPVTAIKPALKAEAQNVTATGAEIAYTVTLPAELEGADVKVFYDETEATANPIVLSDLNDNTAYSYTLKAVATLGEETYESNPVKVDFRTLRDGAKPMVWYGIADDIVKNAYFTTETADDRRDIPMSIEAVATYNADQTMTVVATPHCQGAITGLVPHITLKGKYDRKPMTVNADGTWSVTTPANVTYEFGEDFDYFYFFLAYDGGDTGNGFFLRGYKAGDENEPVAYGEPAALNLSLSKSALKVGESTAVSAVVTDANGHYLLDEAAEIEVDQTSFTVENNKITATDRGLATVTATAGTITATAEIMCVTSSNAKDLIDLADESCIITHSGTIAAGSDVNFAFNKDEGNELSWDCSNDNYSHWVSVNFGKLKKIQAIELVWEGASAKEYTVTLSKTAPADSKRKAFDQNGTTFTVTDGVGGAGMVVRQVLHDKEFKDIEAQHVTLQTVAPSTGWGIKLKQMYVYGTDASTSGIENVEAEAEGAVEYFNLQGVRVENPESGLYIRRQGNKATKVFVK